MTTIDTIKNHLDHLKNSGEIDSRTYRKGNSLYVEGACQVISHGSKQWEVLVENYDQEHLVNIVLQEDENGEATLTCKHNGRSAGWDATAVASLLQLTEDLKATEPKDEPTGKKYTRQGMMKRALEERREKAMKADYRITFADNIHGEHTLVNEKGQSFKITLRDFEQETGYINNPDLKTNKLGTTKHLIFAFNKLKEQPGLMEHMDTHYPFVEIYLDPLNEYRITWHYPHPMRAELKQLIDRFFNQDQTVPDQQVPEFLHFLDKANTFPEVKIRPEVDEKVRKAWDERMLEDVRKNLALDFSILKTDLFPYQKEGVNFATGRSGAIIADDMGLGKTVQAVGTAVMKKELFGFNKTLIVCPASLKSQWKQEIEKFSHEKAVVAEGLPHERAELYRTTDAYFVIVNYETVLRDLRELNRMESDFVILDEAQRIKNYTTITADTIKRLHRRHSLVITGTPLENRLTELYSVVQFVDPGYLAPLWEFSYQHCYFDPDKKNKITGHYNLKELKQRLEPILIRREKRSVIKQLPNITEVNVPVNLHPEQSAYHSNFAKGVSQILRKKFMTPYDHQRLMLLLTNMRMCCNSTYLIDKESHFSPKLHELKHILLDKLNIRQAGSKIIIFSEWVTMLQLIGQMLQELEIGFVRLSGQVAVKNRSKLIEKFENDPNCKVFLSTEAGGSGLNLQVADTVVNFELPWNPAKKNQRLGRIDRIGQEKNKLTVVNLVTRNSIETRIASGLTLKQNLFEGVLDSDSNYDTIDFAEAGKAEFLKQIEESISGFTDDEPSRQEEEETEADQEQTDLDILEELADEENDESFAESPTGTSNSSESTGSNSRFATSADERKQRAKEAEEVMNKGLEFFNGLFKMSTGSKSGLEDQQMKFNEETGEIEMRFKLPGF